MWVSFAVAFVFLTTLLYLPGAVFLRSLGTSRLGALCMAPLVCITFFGVTGIVFDLLGVECHTTIAVAPLLVTAVVSACVRAWLDHRARLRAASEHGGADQAVLSDAVVFGRPGLSWRMVAVAGLFVVVGVIVTSIVFLRGLDGPASHMQWWDNVCHYNLIRTMVESGNWSTVDTTYYPTISGINPFVAGNGFYPAVWHQLGAVLVDSLGVPVTLAANVVHATTTAVVYPLAMCLLLSLAFERRTSTVALGALCCLAFGAFPWAIIGGRWFCWPYCLSLALSPAVASAFMGLIAHGTSPRRRRACLVAFLVGGGALVLTQACAVFTVGVFLVPYIVWRILSALRSRGALPSHVVLAVSAFLVFVVVMWVVFFRLPFMQGVVQYYRPPFQLPLDALYSIFDVSFVEGVASPVLGLLVLVGFVAALHSSRTRWLTVSYLLFLSIFYVSTTGGDTFLKHFLTGFWYTEPYRTAALCAFAAVPLAALGLQVCVNVLAAHLGRFACARPRGSSHAAVVRPGAGRVPRGLPVAVVGVIFFALAFGPALRTGLGIEIPGKWRSDLALLTKQIEWSNEYDLERGYTADEQAFVGRVLDLLGPDEPVLNSPYDGSIYAYGVDGLNVYYRSQGGYGTDEERDASVVLRKSLADIGEAPSVRQVVEGEGIHYVMKLHESDSNGYYFPNYRPEDWEGIEDVDDDTPGLEVVLAEGDMRLYRIVD